MCKKTAAEVVFQSAMLFLPCGSKWRDYLNTFLSFLKQQNLSALKEIISFFIVCASTNIYTD